jgi:hypothetical protein
MMMLVHESGHVLGAWSSGGHVQRVVWHPLVFSQTDVNPNPRPMLVVCAGPVWGSLLPAALAAAVAATRWAAGYLVTCFGGFCLLANGAYIGIGAFGRVGDAGDMLRLGAPIGVLVAFGIVSAIGGFWMMDRASGSMGFGKQPTPVRAGHAWGMLAAAGVVWGVGLVVGR